jgi:hypothetical protein
MGRPAGQGWNLLSIAQADVSNPTDRQLAASILSLRIYFSSLAARFAVGSRMDLRPQPIYLLPPCETQPGTPCSRF